MYVVPSMDEKINLELTTLVWLDKMADATQENREIQDKLRSVINKLRIFDNCQECENYIKQENNIILIVSGQLGQQIIENIHQLKQIISIFVFCGNKEKNELWAKKYPKIRSVIVEIDNLLNEIESDRKSNEYKINEPMKISSDKNEIIEILLQINDTLIDRRQFLNICFNEYQGNLIELENIEEFEHLYKSINSLKYFSKETFLYRLLIKSLQIFNIDIIYLLRFFLQDIEEQLKLCSIVNVPVYHGQLMTNKQIEFIEDSVKKYSLRFNSYLIATKNREEILKTLENSSNKINFKLVLFHIETNNIGKEYQNLIIFPITIQFNVNSIEYQNNIYIINISIISNLNSYSKKNPFQFISHLRYFNRLDEAQIIVSRLLTQYPKKTCKLYNELAQIYQDKGLYEISLEFYEKCLNKISLKTRPYCLNNMACIYDYLEQYDLALDFYSTTLNLLTNDLKQAMCMNNIAITLTKQQKYEHALQLFEQSLAILPENHQYSGICYANIAGVYLYMDQYDFALKYYEKSLKILPKNCSYKGIIYQNLGEIFSKKNQLKESLNNYQQASIIFHKIRPINHPTIIYIEQIITQLKQIKS